MNPFTLFGDSNSSIFVKVRFKNVELQTNNLVYLKSTI
jgi:hypothetical protein